MKSPLFQRMTFEDLKKELEKRDLDLERIEDAYKIAEKAHRNQFRKSGEPYIAHPLAVAEIVTRAGANENIICASLLHDVLEDAEESEKKEFEKEIHDKFGTDVYFLVEAVTKDTNILDTDERMEEYFTRFKELLRLGSGISLIKIADLLHNVSTISGLSAEKRKKWISELERKYMPVISENFHRVPPAYHFVYRNLMNELESFIEKYEEENS